MKLSSFGPNVVQLESQRAAHRQVVLGVLADRAHRALPGHGWAKVRSVS